MTSPRNTAATVDADAFAVRRRIHIAAPLERVWATVTEPALISRWLGDTVLDGSGPGATGTVSWPDRGSIPLRIERVTPMTAIAYRWNNDDAAWTPPERFDAARSTLFTFTLLAVDGGTELTVVETGFAVTSDPVADLDSHRRGWDAELDELVVLLEGAA